MNIVIQQHNPTNFTPPSSNNNIIMMDKREQQQLTITPMYKASGACKRKIFTPLRAMPRPEEGQVQQEPVDLSLKTWSANNSNPDFIVDLSLKRQRCSSVDSLSSTGTSATTSSPRRKRRQVKVRFSLNCRCHLPHNNIIINNINTVTHPSTSTTPHRRRPRCSPRCNPTPSLKSSCCLPNSRSNS